VRLGRRAIRPSTPRRVEDERSQRSAVSARSCSTVGVVTRASRLPPCALPRADAASPASRRNAGETRP
jgi:hypothetical protein